VAGRVLGPGPGERAPRRGSRLDAVGERVVADPDPAIGHLNQYVADPRGFVARPDRRGSEPDEVFSEPGAPSPSMTPEEFRRLGYRIVDWIADYRAQAGSLPVMSRAEPGAVRAQLPSSPPAGPESFASILEDFEQRIVPGLSHWQHPSFFGYFPSNGELSSVLGDYLSTGLGVLGLSWQSSPALTELEEVVCDWVRQMVGLSPAWSGVIQDTASTATLVALVCARERASGFSLARGGLQGQKEALVVYVSAHSHSSVEKAALLAGFGRANLRSVATDEVHAMRPDALTAMVRDDLAQGLRPCAVVATSGTTTSTAFDPIAAIAAVAGEHGLWLHVDAAMAGSAMILPECRPLWQGIEDADSLVLNAHKWLGAAFDCSLYYVRDPEHLVRVMSTNPSYLQSAVDSRVKNLRDWGIPLGRRFRALKLWCLIREQGVEGLQRRLRRDLENARWLEAQIRAAPSWRVLAPVALQTICVRHEPAGLAADALDRHTLEWADRLNRSGAAYVTPAILEGRWMVRVSVGALATEREHVEALWTVMQQEADRPDSTAAAI
jgi:aromatic-L-amino-acid decarboxylase